MGFPRGGRRSAAILSLLLIGGAAGAGCYDTGDGSPPPLASFYYPVGLAVSHGGTVLYAVNSNFDLQFNGGTLQSYNLSLIRRHAVLAVKDPSDPRLPVLPGHEVPPGSCPAEAPALRPDDEGKQPLGETCAPPVDSQFYFRGSAVIGAFATDLLLSRPPWQLAAAQPEKVHADDPPPAVGNASYDRLFVPVRGNATLTWATVIRDNFTDPVPEAKGAAYAPFAIDCGINASGRCDASHEIGEDINEAGNTRHIKMPGEPFGAAISEDGRFLAMTHQNDTRTSLFSTSLGRDSANPTESNPVPVPPPALQFVVDKVPYGGVGLASVPHDPDAFLGSGPPNPAFYQTSRTEAQISLLRSYADDGASIGRPYLDFETTFPITVTPSGIDSRGIVIDPTPRLACKAKVAPVGPGQTADDRDRQIQACARKPARAFIANRAPASLLIGDVGAASTSVTTGTTYDPDRLVIHKAVPLSAGPSRVYLAPIVDRDGAYALRVFVVCFDASMIFVYDPDADALESVIRTGPGPFAMAFDPFTFEDVASHAQVPMDTRNHLDGLDILRRYRFAYLASFTQSFMQVIDLDNAVSPATFERIVYTVGLPTNPKGS